MADEQQAAEAKPPKVDSTLSKGLQILEALAAGRGARGVSELSRDLGLTKSNVFRLLQTLTALGYVRPTEDKRYQATLKTWQVGRGVVENFNLRELAAQEMQMLSAETGEAIYLAVAEGLGIVYIDKIESTQPIRSGIRWRGLRRSIACVPARPFWRHNTRGCAGGWRAICRPIRTVPSPRLRSWMPRWRSPAPAVLPSTRASSATGSAHTGRPSICPMAKPSRRLACRCRT